MYETGSEQQKALEQALIGAATVPRITRAKPLVETRKMKKKKKENEEKQSRKQLQKRVQVLEKDNNLFTLKEKIRKKEPLKRTELEKLTAAALRELAVEAKKDLRKKRKKEDLIEQLLSPSQPLSPSQLLSPSQPLSPSHTIRVRLDPSQGRAFLVTKEKNQ
jgi:hypothetical protein